MRGQSYSNKKNNSNKEDFQGGETKVMKKSLKMLLVFALVFSMFAPAIGFAAEAEMDAQAKFDAMVEAGILEGIDGEAALDKNMQRNEVAKILANIFELEVVANAATPFPDEPADNWGYTDGYIQAVVASGLMIGGEKEDGTIGFRPSAQLSVQELAVVLARALGLELDADAEVEGKTSSWATPHVAAVLAAELLPASADFTVDATRGDLVNSTYEVYVYVEEMKAAEEAAKVLTVESVTALNLAEVEVKFSTAVDKDTVSLGNFKVNGDGLDANLGDSSTVSEDGKTVTFFKKSGFAIQQQVQKVSLAGVKSVGGNEMTAVVDQEIRFVDLSVPELVSVTATGNQLLTLEFNEPINADHAATKVYSNFRIDGKVLVGDATKTPSISKNKVTIELASALAAGEHTFDFINNTVLDYAGFSAVADGIKFNVVEDKVAPTVVEVKKAEQNRVEIQFSKDIRSANVYWMNGFVKHSATVTPTAADKSLVVATFADGNALPLTPVTLVVENATDFSGNVMAKTDLSVTAIADITRPSVTTVVPAGNNPEGAMIITFDEAVRLATAQTYGNIEVKNSAGNIVANTAAYNTNSAGADVKTQIRISGSFGHSGAPYTVRVEGVEDNSVQRNKSLTQSFTVSTADVAAPVLSAAQVLAASPYEVKLSFNESVNASTVSNLSNYTYETATGSYVSLPSGTTATVSNNSQVVTLTFPSTWKVGGILVDAYTHFNNTLNIMVRGITDLAGNTMPTTAKVVTNHASETAATVTDATYVSATSTKSLRIQLTTGVMPVEVYAGDFEVFAGTTNLGVTGATLDSANNRINLNISATLNADGTYGNGVDPIRVKTKGTVYYTKTALGTPIFVDATGYVNDLIRGYIAIPTATGALVVAGDTATVSFNENIQLIATGSQAASAFTVRDRNGKVLVEGTDYTLTAPGGSSDVAITMLVTYTGHLTVELANNTRIRDTAGNLVNNFSTVQTESQVVK